jgi:hypothetical protein
MRFAIRAGFAMGILLPVLETYRRGFGEWRVDFTTMFEDYLGGALLLAGAWAASRRRPAGDVGLLVAWACVTGMMTISCISQIEDTLRGVDLEPRNVDVLIVKGVLLAVSAAALAGVFREVVRRARPASG